MGSYGWFLSKKVTRTEYIRKNTGFSGEDRLLQ